MILLGDTNITRFLKGDVENDILKSAYSRIHDYHDPLRGPVFALLMRELLRITMKRLVPDDKVKSASWCNGEPWAYVDSRDRKTKITKRSRYRFAITGTISDAKLAEYPELDCAIQIQDLKGLDDKLSEFAHISPGAHGLSVEDSNNFLHEVEEIVSEYVNKLEETKRNVGEIVFKLVASRLNSHLMEALPSELEELSLRTRVDSVTIEELEDFDTSTAFPILSGSAHAAVELSYEGNSNWSHSEQSFPFEFNVNLNPDTFDVSVTFIDVDTSSFYEIDRPSY